MNLDKAPKTFLDNCLNMLDFALFLLIHISYVFSIIYFWGKFDCIQIQTIN